MSARTPLIVLAVLVVAAGLGTIAWFLFGDDDTSATPDTTTTSGQEASPTTTSAAPSESTSPGSGTYTPVFEEADCDFDLVTDRPMRCGQLVVPENRDDPTGAEVRIQVAIFESTDPAAPDDPILYLDGGPGGETLETLQFSLEPTWAPFIENRDVIFFDQRGVGTSTPSLECPETRQLTFEIIDDDLDGAEYAAMELEDTEACRDRLVADDIDLTRYHSATNAADVADLRVALDIDEWNLLGISYGTRLAQTVMRDHPDGIRSVILDSTYSPKEDLVTSTPANLVRAFEELWAGCAADAECAAAYPDLEDRFWALRDQLDAEPLFADVTDVFTQDEYQAIVNGDTLIGAFFQGLYSADTIPVLPKIVADLEAGDTSDLAVLLTNNLANGAFFSWGMHLSVECFEEVPFADEAAVASAAEEADPRLGDYFEGATNVGPAVFDLCEMWQAGTAGPVENQPVVSDLPTLVMAGQYDPITPSVWGERAADDLSAATFVEFPAVGHAASVSADCPRDVAIAFFDDPTAPPDTSCIDAMAPIDFLTDDERPAPVEMVPFEQVIFGLPVSGVRPEGWDPYGNGTWLRSTNSLDSTLLVQQAVPVPMPPDEALGLLESTLDFEEGPEQTATVDAASRSWTVYEGTAEGELTLIAVGPGDNDTGVVILTLDPAERDTLYADVMVPALEAFAIG